MANNLTRNPWVLDTAGATDLWPHGVVFVDHFELVGYEVASDQVIVEDADGNVIWKGDGSADLTNVISNYIGPLQHGFVLDTLPSNSQLLVFMKAGGR